MKTQTTKKKNPAPAFTAGPWTVHPDFPDVVVIAEHVGRKIGGSVDPDREASEYAKEIHHGRHSDEFPQFHRSRVMKAESIANARLIAAAPELFAVVQAVERYGVLHLNAECRRLIAKVLGS